jgi:hypothetical protein
VWSVPRASRRRECPVSGRPSEAAADERVTGETERAEVRVALPVQEIGPQVAAVVAEIEAEPFPKMPLSRSIVSGTPYASVNNATAKG